jgi:glycosyltransferase involved in cell wall biosynthesis
MNILAAEKYHFVTGGASRVFFETNRLLESRGHSVAPFTGGYPENLPTPYAKYFVPRFTMFSGDGGGRPDRAPAAGMLKAFVDAIYARDVAAAARRIVADFRPDVAHLHTILYQLSPSLIETLKALGVPVVQTLHDFSLVCGSRYLFTGGAVCERCRRRRYHHILLRNCCNGNRLLGLMCFSAKLAHSLFRLYPGKVDLFIAPSRFVRDKMIAWGLPARRIETIGHFLPASAAAADPADDHDGSILFAGYLIRQKGIFTLLAAMARVPRLRLRIAGRGPEGAAVEAAIRRLGLTNVEMLGFLRGEDLERAVRRAAFLVFPSESYETFGMGILEAHLAGKPVVASDLGAYPELVEDGKRGGLLFAPGNPADLAAKLETLARDDGLRRELGRSGREHALRAHGPDTHYDQLLSAYERVIGHA